MIDRVTADLRKYEAEQDAWDAAEPSQSAIKEKLEQMRWELIADDDWFVDVLAETYEAEYEAIQKALIASMKGDDDAVIRYVKEAVDCIHGRVSEEDAEYKLRSEALDDLDI